MKEFCYIDSDGDRIDVKVWGNGPVTVEINDGGAVFLPVEQVKELRKVLKGKTA